MLVRMLKDAPSVVGEIADGITFGLVNEFSVACRKFAFALGQTGPAKLFKAIEPFAILIAIIAFGIELSDRREERAARAWQLVTTNANGNSGKIDALQYLNSQSKDWLLGWWPYAKKRTPLVGLDLTPPELAERWKKTNASNRTVGWSDCPGSTFLNQVELPRAKLAGANFPCADLSGANLNGADLSYAFLSGTNLLGADLSGTIFSYADISGANFNDANVSGANFGDHYLAMAEGLNQRKLDIACITKDGEPPIVPPHLSPSKRICPITKKD